LKVIALNGLNVRSGPSLQADIIGGLSFLEEVQVLRVGDRIDTLGYRTFYAMGQGPYQVPVYGPWFEVKHGNRTGYVHSAYLDYFAINREEWLPGVNDRYGLAFTGGSCFDILHRNASLNWYGLYQKGPERYELRPLQISYVIDPSDIMLTYILGGEQGLIFMFGTEDEFGRREIIGQHFDWQEGILRNDSNNKTDSIAQVHGLQQEDRPMSIFLEKGAQRQLLNSDNYRFPGPHALLWTGDLDGDEQDDYVIMYGDKVSATVLYLSSEAEAGMWVKPVAIFYSGYCC
jgi:hypothetical protein